jgi:hypothetical protein
MIIPHRLHVYLAGSHMSFESPATIPYRETFLASYA